MGFSSIGALAAVLGAAGSAASAGLSIANAVKGAPKLPAPQQGVKSPTADMFSKKNAGTFNPGALLANQSLLGAGAGPSQNVGTSTLLGQ